MCLVLTLAGEGLEAHKNILCCFVGDQVLALLLLLCELIAWHCLSCLFSGCCTENQKAGNVTF